MPYLAYPWLRLCLKHISDCNYLIEQATGDYTQMIVHFNHLKPCKPGTRFPVNSDGESQVNADPPTSLQVQKGSNLVGENLELVETNEKTTSVLPADRAGRYTSIIPFRRYLNTYHV